MSLVIVPEYEVFQDNRGKTMDGCNLRMPVVGQIPVDPVLSRLAYGYHLRKAVKRANRRYAAAIGVRSSCVVSWPSMRINFVGA